VVDLFVARRRRCPDIACFSLLDLASQAPSANITVFMEGSTKEEMKYSLCPVHFVHQQTVESIP